MIRRKKMRDKFARFFGVFFPVPEDGVGEGDVLVLVLSKGPDDGVLGLLDGRVQHLQRLLKLGARKAETVRSSTRHIY